MTGQLAPATPGGPLGKKDEGNILDRHSPGQNQRLVAIVGENKIIAPESGRHRAERLVTHAGDLKPALALTAEDSLASVRLASLQHRAQNTHLLPGFQFSHKPISLCTFNLLCQGNREYHLTAVETRYRLQ
jgi:hypothetical protein